MFELKSHLEALKATAETAQSGINKVLGASQTTLDEYKALNQDLGQNEYSFRYLVFPNDLGMDDNGHYMIININVPTKLGGQEAAGNFQEYFNVVDPIQRSKVDTLRYANGISGAGAGENSPRNGIGMSIPRFTRRIKESVALFMPTPLIFNTQHVFEDISLTALAGKIGIGAASVISPKAGALASTAFNAARVAGSLSGNPINPAVEILFATTPVRQFAFELLLAPRNEAESITIWNLIKTLRFHAAPEINTLTAGLTWIPPADFDITFFQNGKENTNLLRINTCVLERIEVDYSPTSGIYSTFRNGHPVAVRLSLGFRELEPVHKQRITQGF